MYVFCKKYIIDISMTILITGSAGFIGSALCLRLLERGDKIIGIGTMHKSNAVPIFSDDAAKDISKMRR